MRHQETQEQLRRGRGDSSESALFSASRLAGLQGPLGFRPQVWCFLLFQEGFCLLVLLSRQSFLSHMLVVSVFPP